MASVITKCRTTSAVFQVCCRFWRCAGFGRFVKPLKRIPQLRAFSTFKRIDNENNRFKLAESLANIVDETSRVEEQIPQSRLEIKRLHELRIKKRVKERYVNGKFNNLMKNVIANPKTLEDAYNCILVNSHIDVSSSVTGDLDFESLSSQLSDGSFDVKANVFAISTRGERKEVLVLPNIKLKVAQEAIRIVLEVVYRPYFSKISHGGRSGRGHSSALKYICKEISNPDWWFTVHLSKKIDIHVLDKLFFIMQDKIQDSELFCVIRKMFDAQVLNLEFGGFPKGHGLPQEGVLSPILMNIYLDLFDQEFYKISMRYEALGSCSQFDENGPQSRLRNWFRRQLKEDNVSCADQEKFALRVYACRFMDEIFFAVSGSNDAAHSLKSDIQNYLQDSLHLDVADDAVVLPCSGPHGIRFLGALVKRIAKESPAMRAVHKLKEKVQLFASQKQEIWDAGMVRIGKKCLAHGLRKVKESEIEHLADSGSLLCKISSYRKHGMETDHWYKQLLKIWMQDANVKTAASEELILSNYIAEPAIPPELRDSFYEFQRCAEEFISSEADSLLSLLSSSSLSDQCENVTVIIAPVNVIKKRLIRYGLTSAEGYARPSSHLVLLDSIQIIDWFSGIVRRWLRWYQNSDNFAEVKLIISGQLRKSCILTLASKYRMPEPEIEKCFDSELSKIPSTLEIEHEMGKEILDSCGSDYDMKSTYETPYGGLCLLSLSRMVSKSRPCFCFVIGCSAPAPCVYTLHVMERQKFPGWKTGFSTCIHPSLNKRRIGLCKQHLNDLCLGEISLQTINFGAWS